MNLTLDTKNKTVIINDTSELSEFYTYIKTLIDSKVIDYTWTIGPYVNFYVTGPTYYSTELPTCNGNCMNTTGGCTCNKN